LDQENCINRQGKDYSDNRRSLPNNLVTASPKTPATEKKASFSRLSKLEKYEVTGINNHLDNQNAEVGLFLQALIVFVQQKTDSNMIGL
jgi:hypothetical protein